MKKDAYFFNHYCNARHDRKIRRLRKDLGMEGYGIYFMLLEVLREQMDYRYPFKDVDLLSEEFGVSDAKVKAVIAKFDLFEIDDEENFFSPKFILYLQPYIEKTQRARLAAKVRWDKINIKTHANALPEHSGGIAPSMQLQCPSNADAMQGEESKGDKSKGDKSKGEESIKELRAHADAILSYFSLSSDNNPYESNLVCRFVKSLMDTNRLTLFSQQFEAYKQYKDAADEFRHGIKSYLGTSQEMFADGNWNAENWPEKLRQFRSRTSAQEGSTLTDVQKQILEKTSW